MGAELLIGVALAFVVLGTETDAVDARARSQGKGAPG